MTLLSSLGVSEVSLTSAKASADSSPGLLPVSEKGARASPDGDSDVQLEDHEWAGTTPTGLGGRCYLSVAGWELAYIHGRPSGPLHWERPGRPGFGGRRTADLAYPFPRSTAGDGHVPPSPPGRPRLPTGPCSVPGQTFQPGQSTR